MCNLSPEQLAKCFSMTLDALDRTLDFIHENDLKHPTRIDYINYLLGYFIFHSGELSDADREKLIDWVDCVDFTNLSNTERREIFTALVS